MNRRLICLILLLSLLFTAFIPFASADYTVLYASDGRTRQVDAAEVHKWIAVGWFPSPEDAKIITMYSMDGRTIELPQYHRAAFNAVGWYDTKEEVTTTMYSMDGRSLVVYKDKAEAHNKVGWYYNLSDVTVKMYDTDGNEYTIYKANIEKEKQNGLTDNLNDVKQLMFSADGRFLYVPFKDVEAFNQVGWYTAGTKLDPSRPMVALTFDDGPGRYTDEILSILEKYNARATFFVQGKAVAGYRDVLQRAVRLGNEIGNHTWGHANLTGGVGNQISSTNTAVYNATGIYPKIYRPPYGSYNSYVLNQIAMPAIMWSVDTLDWKTRNAAKTLASVKKDTRNGSIILMHDIHKPTKDAVEPVVRHLLMSGYQLVTVSELLNTRYGSMVSGRVYNNAH